MVNPDDPKYPIGTLFIIDHMPDYKFVMQKTQKLRYTAVKLLGGNKYTYQPYIDNGSQYLKSAWSRYNGCYFNSVFNPVEKVDKKYEDLYT